MSSTVLDLKWILLAAVNIEVREVMFSLFSSPFTVFTTVRELVLCLLIILFLISDISASTSDHIILDIKVRVPLIHRNNNGGGLCIAHKWYFLLFTLSLIASLFSPTEYFIYSYPFLIILSLFPWLFATPSSEFSDNPDNVAPHSPPNETTYLNLTWVFLFLSIVYYKPYFVNLLFNDAITFTFTFTITTAIESLFVFLVLPLCCFVSIKLYLTEHSIHGLIINLGLAYQPGFSLLTTCVFVLSFFFPNPSSILCFITLILTSLWPHTIENILRRNLHRAYASLRAFLAAPNHHPDPADFV